MAYSNGYNQNRGGGWYGNRGYQNRGGYGGGYNQGNRGYQNGGGYNAPQQPVKKSGAKYSIIKKGNFIDMPIINAWQKTRQGILTITVKPYHASEKQVKSARNTFTKMIAEVQYPSGQHRLIPVLYNEVNKKVTISELNLLITPAGAGVTGTGKHVTGSVVKLSKR